MKTRTLTLLLTLTLTSMQAQGNKGNRLTTRIAQVLGFQPKQLMITTTLAVLTCTMLSCGTIKPHLYDIGLLNPSSAMQAKTIAEAVLVAQRGFVLELESGKELAKLENGKEDAKATDRLQVMHNHAYLLKPMKFGYEPMLVEIIKENDRLVTVKGYANKYKLTVSPETVKGYLIDNHPNVGRVVKLTSDAVGITHFNGMVFAVYNNGIHAIKITSKTTLDGEQEELHGKDDAPHIRFAYEDQLY